MMGYHANTRIIIDGVDVTDGGAPRSISVRPAPIRIARADVLLVAAFRVGVSTETLARMTRKRRKPAGSDCLHCEAGQAQARVEDAIRRVYRGMERSRP